MNGSDSPPLIDFTDFDRVIDQCRFDPGLKRLDQNDSRFGSRSSKVIILIILVEINLQNFLNQNNILGFFLVRYMEPAITDSVLAMLEDAHPRTTLLPSNAVIEMMPIYMQNCFARDKTMHETMDGLTRFNVPPAFTQLVWETLEQKNPELFQAYYARLEWIHQDLNGINNG